MMIVLTRVIFSITGALRLNAASSGETGRARQRADVAQPPLNEHIMTNDMNPSALKSFDLTGRTALVTGSSVGIGYALARGLASAGARVILNGRNAQKLEQAADRLRAEGAFVLSATFDVTDGAAVVDGVGRIEAEVGPIDILVNNAGMQRRAPLEQFEEGDWHELMKTNVDSVFLVGQAVARHMIDRRRGKIINICSVQSELGRPNIAPYTASKGAVKMLTKGMAIDWGQYNIQVNGLGPGYFKTELTEALVNDAEFTRWLVGRTPSRRWGDVQDLVGAAVFLASDASNFVNGHILYVDGGVTATL
jgi:gluconate 5-dehydrogenase